MKTSNVATAVVWLATGVLVVWIVASFVARGEGFDSRLRIPSTEQSPRTLAGTTVPDVQVPLLSKDQSTVDLMRAEDDRLRLMVVFSFTDCYRGFRDAEFWTELQDLFESDLAVLAVASGSSPQVLRHFVAGQGLNIPVAYDSTGIFGTFLGKAGILSPAPVLASEDGIILSVDAIANGDSLAQAQYRQKIENSISERTSGPMKSQ